MEVAMAMDVDGGQPAKPEVNCVNNTLVLPPRESQALRGISHPRYEGPYIAAATIKLQYPSCMLLRTVVRVVDSATGVFYTPTNPDERIFAVVNCEFYRVPGGDAEHTRMLLDHISGAPDTPQKGLHRLLPIILVDAMAPSKISEEWVSVPCTGNRCAVCDKDFASLEELSFHLIPVYVNFHPGLVDTYVVMRHQGLVDAPPQQQGPGSSGEAPPVAPSSFSRCRAKRKAPSSSVDELERPRLPCQGETHAQAQEAPPPPPPPREDVPSLLRPRKF